MVLEVSDARRYALSFTSGALLMREALIAAPIYLRVRDWSEARRLIERQNLLQARTRTAGQRLAREVTQRLAVLNKTELELLIEATSQERGHLLWAAACRRYDLIGEFAEEVLRERFLLRTSTVDHKDFESFVHNKAIWHEELANLRDSTLRKLRANLFRMLVDAGLLSDDGRIVPAIVSERVSEVLSARSPSDLRYFPTVNGVR